MPGAELSIVLEIQDPLFISATRSAKTFLHDAGAEVSIVLEIQDPFFKRAILPLLRLFFA